jgi:hypothetical protein
MKFLHGTVSWKLILALLGVIGGLCYWVASTRYRQSTEAEMKAAPAPRTQLAPQATVESMKHPVAPQATGESREHSVTPAERPRTQMSGQAVYRAMQQKRRTF